MTGPELFQTFLAEAKRLSPDDQDPKWTDLGFDERALFNAVGSRLTPR